MALASWTGLYTPVVQALMRSKRIKELLLLQLIAQHADPFGFAFPGVKTLVHFMRCSKPTLDGLMEFLETEGYIKIYQTYNPRRGKTETDFQINPRVLYVREEIQTYCEALWDGENRDFEAEKKYRGNLFSTKDSQPESESESESKSVSRVSIQSQHHHTAQTAKARPVTTRRTSAALQPQPQSQRDSAIPQREAHDSKTNPQAGGSAAGRDVAAYRKPLPTLDDEQLAQDIKITVGTQATQARWAVMTYSRSEVCIALELVRQKRSRGELAKPGGYFFAALANGIIVPEEDGPPVFPPRQALDLEGRETWNPDTGRYEQAGD